jgi:two-component system sensor histidine kinase DesK
VVLGFVLLATLFAPINPGAACLFIFAATYLARLDDPPTAFVCLGILLALEALECWLMRLPATFWIPTLVFSALIGAVVIQWVHRRRLADKLLAAQAENEHLAKVAERERIARDLHDVLGHTLSVIVLKAELAGRLIQLDPQRAASEIGEVERTARTALAEVREAIGGYRARGLVAEIEAARRTLDAAGVTLLCDTMPASNTGLRANEETVLALALREAVTNIVRHARATTCTLRFHIDNNQHRLSIEDNGEHREAREGNGLRGMRERIEALGGHISLDRNSGTRLLIELPLRTGTA